MEIQHRAEPLFARRTLLYSAAEISSQVNDKETFSKGEILRPVHSLSFCDFDFKANPKGTTSVVHSKWRTSTKPHVPDIARSLQMFSLRSKTQAMKHVIPSAKVNTALANEMGNFLSFTFVLLPHVPPLHSAVDWTGVPPLLQWAAVIAHAKADIQTKELPPALQQTHKIERLVDVMNDAKTKEIVEEEDIAAAVLEKNEQIERSRLKYLNEEWAIEHGIKEGMVRLLESTGIKSRADFEQRFGFAATGDALDALFHLESKEGK